MTKRRYLITADEAVETRGQTKRPCSDCPWARTALPGWLGSATKEEWIAVAHGETKVDCHTRQDNQCAGLAIYRSNVCKSVRDPSVLRLPADPRTVFAAPKEFMEHHTGVPLERPPGTRPGYVDKLNSAVTGAISEAEGLETRGVDARVAWRRVAEVEAQLAGELAASTLEGNLARLGAIRAALKAGDVPMALTFVEDMLSEQLGR